MTTRIARISITLPAELVRYADREAKRLGRPRSWVIAEALRAASEAGSSEASLRVVEPAAGPYAAIAGELRAADRRRLRAALALSPAERLRRAGELVRLARAARPSHGRVQIAAFETFEEFWRWKQANRVAAAGRI
jgi:predicted transcriptional regulator